MPFDLYPPQSSDTRRHLLSVTDLDRAAIERILDTAHGFESVMQRDVKKVPTLRGRTVMNLFFESSTRTSSSFELAAKRLSADTMSLKASGSSVDKGESLKDTVTTLSAYDPDVIVIRHPQIGAPADHHRLHRCPRRQRRGRQAPASRPSACSTSTRSSDHSERSTACTWRSWGTSCTPGSRAPTSRVCACWGLGSR